MDFLVYGVVSGDNLCQLVLFLCLFRYACRVTKTAKLYDWKMIYPFFRTKRTLQSNVGLDGHRATEWNEFDGTILHSTIQCIDKNQ